MRALIDSPDAYGRTIEGERAVDDDEWRSRVAQPGVGQFVADDGGSVIGMVAVTLAPENPSVSLIFAMWVAPEVRRRGVARALLDAGLDWGRGRGAAEAQLTVTEGNDAAYALYREYGFEPTGRHEPLREGSPLDTVWMRKELS